jgi:hypothetical protein
VAKAYEDHSLEFGPDYLIPKPFDPRLIIKIAPAVAKTAMDSGVATRPIQDMGRHDLRTDRHVSPASEVRRKVRHQANVRAAVELELRQHSVFVVGTHGGGAQADCRVRATPRSGRRNAR